MQAPQNAVVSSANVDLTTFTTDFQAGETILARSSTWVSAAKGQIRPCRMLVRRGSFFMSRRVGQRFVRTRDHRKKLKKLGIDART